VFAVDSTLKTFARTTGRAARFSRIREWFSGCDHHLQAQSLQLANQPVLSSLWMLLIKEVAAPFAILVSTYSCSSVRPLRHGSLTQDGQGAAAISQAVLYLKDQNMDALDVIL
jgi:hypothetical protein